MSVASLSGILEGGALGAPPRANEPIFDSVHIRVKQDVTIRRKADPQEAFFYPFLHQ